MFCIDRADSLGIIVIYADSIWIPRTCNPCCNPCSRVALPLRIDMSPKQEYWQSAAASKTCEAWHVMLESISTCQHMLSWLCSCTWIVCVLDSSTCSECQRTALRSGRTASIREFNFECASIAIAATTNSNPSLTVKHCHTLQPNQPHSLTPTERTHTTTELHTSTFKMPQAQPELKKVPHSLTHPSSQSSNPVKKC